VLGHPTLSRRISPLFHPPRIVTGMILLLVTGCSEGRSPVKVSLETTPSTAAMDLPTDANIPHARSATLDSMPSTTPYGTQIRTADGKIIIRVPAGEFTMGAPDDDPEATANEKPEHPVYLDSFWIDQTETTNAQFRKCVEAGICEAPLTCELGNPVFNDKSKSDHPVTCVSWFDAEAYCGWAGGRLPTEAEWEKAAGGTDGRRYPWGNTIDCTRGNFRGCLDYSLTAPVGSFPSGAGPYGAMDMSGNVWEWVKDWMGWEYYDQSPYANPQGPAEGEMRIVRGGSWRYGFSMMRIATRHCAPPIHQVDALGFRCAVNEFS
jgi:formylglycine-generating enzyme required for sulfatase activity